jgi:hypothetical protein
VVSNELNVAADHVARLAFDERDETSLQFATYAGDDLVGCFRAQIGPPPAVGFGADWALTDFCAVMPEEVALISGFCTTPHLRDRERVTAHMVRESVAVAKDFDLPLVFFETAPELWPAFHAAGLTRQGGVRPDQTSGLLTAVYQLHSRARVRFPAADPVWADVEDGLDGMQQAERQRPRLAIVAGGRG